MHVLVVANGYLDSGDRVPTEQVDLVVCANGGTRHAHKLGLQPQVVVGDMDSLPPDLLAALQAAGTVFLSFSPSKDETDLELALLYAVESGATRITILGARGGRVDHELGNLLLLVHPRLEGIEVRIRAGNQDVALIRQQATLNGAPGDLLSLLPVGGDAFGVTTSGLVYPLHDETLFFGPARGVSNVFAVPNPGVSLRSGLLFVVHTRQSGQIV